jgi:hypothetical protein
VKRLWTLLLNPDRRLPAILASREALCGRSEHDALGDLPSDSSAKTCRRENGHKGPCWFEVTGV